MKTDTYAGEDTSRIPIFSSPSSPTASQQKEVEKTAKEMNPAVSFSLPLLLQHTLSVYCRFCVSRQKTDTTCAVWRRRMKEEEATELQTKKPVQTANRKRRTRYRRSSEKGAVEGSSVERGETAVHNRTKR